jgi:hypothetical protein
MISSTIILKLFLTYFPVSVMNSMLIHTCPCHHPLLITFEPTDMMLGMDIRPLWPFHLAACELLWSIIANLQKHELSNFYDVVHKNTEYVAAMVTPCKQL